MYNWVLNTPLEVLLNESFHKVIMEERGNIFITTNKPWNQNSVNTHPFPTELFLYFCIWDMENSFGPSFAGYDSIFVNMSPLGSKECLYLNL